MVSFLFESAPVGYRANAGDKNRRAFQQIVKTADAPPGVLAYDGNEVVGWAAVLPLAGAAPAGRMT